MPLYLLYVIGSAACQVLPRGLCYWIARRVADVWYWHAVRDREAVRLNLEAVLQKGPVPPEQVREVFRNFGMYLADFFRFNRITAEEVQRMVRIEGLERMQAALAQGRGAIGLTAHLGNFELAGAVLTLLGLQVSAVVLTHQDKKVDAFFSRRRERVGVKAIPIQKQSPRVFFESAISALRRNEVLALVGDRDFFNHGIDLPLFGKTIRVPTGPANFSLKTGAPIVPGFLVREADGKYRFILESPIPIPQGVSREEAVRQMTEACLDVMFKYIRQYPTQWYGFREFWRQVPAVVL